jgi:hypothetical protein
MDVLAAFVAAGGSVPAADELVGIQPSTVKRHLADLRAVGLSTERLTYRGRAEGWLLVPSLERCQQIRMGPQARGRCEGLTSTRPA